MFIAIGLMLLGMTLGWLLRGRTWLGLLTVGATRIWA